MKHEAWKIVFASLVLLTTADVRGADWYAAPGGQPVAAGTRADPLELATVIGPQSPARAGDTIYLRGGTYGGQLYSLLEGAEEQPITVRPVPGERVTIDAAAGLGAGLVIGGKWTVWRDVEVTSSHPNRQTEERGRYPGAYRRSDGIVLRGSRLLVAGCIVHDCRSGIVCWSDSRDVEISGCVVYNNGWQDPLVGHGDGIRSQGEEGVKRLVDNVIFNQFGYGVYLYTILSRVRSCEVEGNVSFNNGCLSRDGLRAANFYIGSSERPVREVVFTGNHAWHEALTATTCQLGVGLGSGEMVCTDNTFGGLTRVMGWQRLTMSGNTFVGAATTMELHLPRTTSALEYAWKGNRYFHGPSDWSPFAVYSPSAGGGLTFDGWRRQTGYDAESAFTTGRPAGPRVVVRPDRHISGRAVIVVYNWPRQDEVEVSLEGVVVEGAAYRILNAQDPLGEPVARGTYDGRPIRLKTAGRQGPLAVGGSPRPPPVTGPLFNVFLVREEPPAPLPEPVEVEAGATTAPGAEH